MALGSMVLTLIMLFGMFVLASSAFGAQARYVEGYSFTAELLDRDNPAVFIRFAGMIAAFFVAMSGLYRPDPASIVSTLETAVGTSVLALGALMISRYVNDHITLRGVDNNEAVLKRRNIAVAIVEAATYIATAYIFAGGMADKSHGFFYNAMWFVIGQAALVALAHAYARWFFPNLVEEIEGNNAACALSLAGLTIAGGMCIGALITGPGSNMIVDIARVALSLVVWLALLAVSHAALHLTLVSHTRLIKELVEDHNWSLGLFHGIVFVAFTAAFVSVHT